MFGLDWRTLLLGAVDWQYRVLFVVASCGLVPVGALGHALAARFDRTAAWAADGRTIFAAVVVAPAGLSVSNGYRSGGLLLSLVGGFAPTVTMVGLGGLGALRRKLVGRPQRGRTSDLTWEGAILLFGGGGALLSLVGFVLGVAVRIGVRYAC